MRNRIKDILKDKNMSTKDLSKLVGVSPQNLSKLINGHTKPSIETYEKIADVLDIHFPELFVINKLNGYIEYMGEVHKINSIQDLRNLLENIDGEKRNSDNKI